MFYYLEPGVHPRVLSGSATYLPEPLPSTVRRLSIIMIIMIIMITMNIISAILMITMSIISAILMIIIVSSSSIIIATANTNIIK